MQVMHACVHASLCPDYYSYEMYVHIYGKIYVIYET
jgi:hypothetical protein